MTCPSSFDSGEVQSYGSGLADHLATSSLVYGECMERLRHDAGIYSLMIPLCFWATSKWRQSVTDCMYDLIVSIQKKNKRKKRKKERLLLTSLRFGASLVFATCKQKQLPSRERHRYAGAIVSLAAFSKHPAERASSIRILSLLSLVLVFHMFNEERVHGPT